MIKNIKKNYTKLLIKPVYLMHGRVGEELYPFADTEVGPNSPVSYL